MYTVFFSCFKLLTKLCKMKIEWSLVYIQGISVKLLSLLNVFDHNNSEKLCKIFLCKTFSVFIWQTLLPVIWLFLSSIYYCAEHSSAACLSSWVLKLDEDMQVHDDIQGEILFLVQPFQCYITTSGLWSSLVTSP